GTTRGRRSSTCSPSWTRSTAPPGPSRTGAAGAPGSARRRPGPATPPADGGVRHPRTALVMPPAEMGKRPVMTDIRSIGGGRLTRRQLIRYAGVGATLVAAPAAVTGCLTDPDEPAAPRREPAPDDPRHRAWRAGDHHVHSEYSGGYDSGERPPRFIKGGDAVYPIATNAAMARSFGLSWLVCTDHGGPLHSKIDLEQAYPDLLRSRRLVADVVQFWGMEFDTPARDHHTLMIPHHHGEAEQLFELESRFATRDAFPPDPVRGTGERMVEFLTAAARMPHR